MAPPSQPTPPPGRWYSAIGIAVAGVWMTGLLAAFLFVAWAMSRNE